MESDDASLAGGSRNTRDLDLSPSVVFTASYRQVEQSDPPARNVTCYQSRSVPAAHNAMKLILILCAAFI